MIFDFPAAAAAILPGLQILGLLAVANFVLGTLKAIVSKTFTWDRVADWVKRDVVPIMAYVIFGVIVYAVPAEAWPVVGGISTEFTVQAANIMLVTLAAYLGFSVLANVAALLPEGTRTRLTRSDSGFAQFKLPPKQEEKIPPADG